MEKKDVRLAAKMYLRTTIGESGFLCAAQRVKVMRKIAKYYTLTGEEHHLLETAGWLYECRDSLETFLTGAKQEDTFRDKINFLMNAPVDKNSLLQKIYADSLNYVYGCKNFNKHHERLRREAGTPEKEWLADTISSMKAHHYHTHYARLRWDGRKEQHLRQLETQLKAEMAGKRNDLPEKAAETMFKISSSNHQRLSSMADNKAHILITVNSIILSVLISVLLRKLDEDAYLAYPTFILLTVCVLSITFSIVAIRPVVSDRLVHHTGDGHQGSNLLFFGNISSMTLEKFADGLMQTIAERDDIYRMLICNAYLHSAVLARKSRLLKIAYNIFMYGLIVAVLGFIITSLWHRQQPVNAAIGK